MDENEVLGSKQQFRVLFRLLKYVVSYKKSLWLTFFFIVFATVSNVLGPILIKAMVDMYMQTDQMEMSGIMQYLGLYALTGVSYAIFKYLQVYYSSKIGYQITKELRDALFIKLQSLGMRYFDQTPVGSIVSRVTNDTDAIQDMLNNVLSVIVSSVILMFGIILTMWFIDPMLTGICIAFLPFCIIVMYGYQKYSTKYYQMARERLSQLNTKLSESISGMHIIQNFHQEKRLTKEFDTTNDEYYQASLMNIRLDGLLLAPIVYLIIAFALASIFSFIGYQSFHSYVSAGLIIAFIDYVYKFFEPMYQIMERLAIYQQAIVAGHRIFKILDHEELAPKQNNKAVDITNAKIEFKNVSFSYDGEKEVLSNISFTVEPGEMVALVGHTGSGKSSIINVMMRFYEFTKGEVLIDGVSIKDYPIEKLREKTGLVLQDPFLYYGTINDNIRLLNSNISDAQIKKACEFVQVDPFINTLENNYAHQVIERGAAFSTGQKQLLVFARTIVTDPKILVLDEATANIDTQTESLIQEGLAKIKQGRTTIAIAHRLSTIKDANQILVLDKGNIIERGNHQELIAKKGTYYAMYQLQQSGME